MSRILRAIFQHPSGRIGGTLVLIYFFIALLSVLEIMPYDPLMQFRVDRLQAPNSNYWMGTDLFGRDMASRMMSGIARSFTIAFLSVFLASFIGTLLGLTAAWFGRWWDSILMRVMDILLAFPAVLLALLIVAVVGPGKWTSIVAIAIVYTPIFTRVVRGPALSIKAREFVDAARTFGSSRRFILTRHLLLNLVAPLTVQVTLALAWALLTEAGLSFLGLGTQPPEPSLGLMLSDSRNLMEMAPWLMIFPALTIMISILGFNLLGDSLRDILDPKMHGSKP